ncbi:MAG TPA: cobalamin-binding protein [Syntrophaceticus sp.]|nr:corrinoid protein [Syntrophaceticus schinkii]MDD2359970.1 corrinoid protein [Syntrophaceticus schinkii]MDD4261145.1 corrinoid protein [Syntrophaceticus schinkii]HHY30986.1 cobalamin-binding protein [Syntrophaceticus sp.]
MLKLEKIVECVLGAEMDKVESLVKEGLAEGTDPSVLLKEGLIKGMDVIGEQFENGDLFLPEMLAAAMTMKAGVEILKPHLAGGDSKAAGIVVIGTVQGDIHDIGKNLVAMMLEGAGFEVADVGIDVPPEDFVKAVEEKKPQVVGLSALLTNTMPAVKMTIDALQEAGLRDQVKIMIGGAPVTQEFADEVGADGYASDAAGAVNIARGFI